MICGYFGEIGYVDLIQQKESPRLIGIVHIPRRLVYLVGTLEGDEGLERFYQKFCRETEGDRWKGSRWNLQAHPTEIEGKLLRYLPIDREQYYWKIEKTESDIFKDRRALPEQMAGYETTVRQFIMSLDNHVWGMRPGASPGDRITPDIAKERFDAMQKGGVTSYLPQGNS